MLNNLATILLVPPVNLALLACAGLALAWRNGAWRPGRYARAGRWLAAASLALLLLLALPAVSGRLLAGLETGWPPPAATPPQAIVILGGDVTPVWPDQPGRVLDIGWLTLERLRGGAALQRATGLPVLVTGGVLRDGGEPVAALMARSLAEDFAVPTRWIEPFAADTWDNASFAAAMLRRDGIGTVYVVTHPWHMRRALIAFARAGLAAVPAPLPLDRPPQGLASDFVPRASSWQRSYYALHEWIGTAWYAWRAGR